MSCRDREGGVSMSERERGLSSSCERSRVRDSLYVQHASEAAAAVEESNNDEGVNSNCKGAERDKC